VLREGDGATPLITRKLSRRPFDSVVGAIFGGIACVVVEVRQN